MFCGLQGEHMEVRGQSSVAQGTQGPNSGQCAFCAARAFCPLIHLTSADKVCHCSKLQGRRSISDFSINSWFLFAFV